MGKLQADQSGGLFFWDIAGQQQHLEGLSHAFRADEVLELQRHLGALLRKFTILKRIGKLRFLSDTEQELRLRQQRNRFESVIAATRAQGREIDVRRDVL